MSKTYNITYHTKLSIFFPQYDTVVRLCKTSQRFVGRAKHHIFAEFLHLLRRELLREPARDSVTTSGLRLNLSVEAALTAERKVRS